MSGPDTLNIDVSTADGSVVVKLRGSASMENCEQLNSALLEACESKPNLLVVDLALLDFVCSLGLGGLVTVHVYMQKYGGRFALASPNKAIREMLEVTKLDSLLAIYDTPDEALGSV